MAYVKVSVKKNGDGAGCATAKSSEIIIIDAEDIKSEPTREVGNVVAKGDLILNEGAKAVSIYATTSSIEVTEEISGDADARGIMQGVAYEHPGNSVDIKNHTEAFLNKGVVIMVKECDGSTEGRVQLIGSKCNPLYLTLESTNNKEATKRKFTWKQEMAGKYLAADYAGAVPDIADPATASENEEGA